MVKGRIPIHEPGHWGWEWRARFLGSRNGMCKGSTGERKEA